MKNEVNLMNIEIEFISTPALQVAEYEATSISVLYNNSLFLALVILASVYILNVSNRFTTTNFIQFCPLSGDLSPHELCPQYWTVQGDDGSLDYWLSEIRWRKGEGRELGITRSFFSAGSVKC